MCVVGGGGGGWGVGCVKIIKACFGDEFCPTITVTLLYFTTAE